MTDRKKTSVVRIGCVSIGGDNPVAVQSMTKTDTRDAAATALQIEKLASAGCEIVRVAVPDKRAAETLRDIKRMSPEGTPICADIHFNHELAIAAIKSGADKLRINPGNIGGKEKLRELAEAAKKSGTPIRVGVNSGSLERGIYERHGNRITPEGLAESALNNVALLERADFYDIVVSLKSPDAQTCYKAYKIVSEAVDYPLHLGVTEAGTAYSGSVKSAACIGGLLLRGIGDTIRVSLTGDPLEEVRCAKEILKALKLRDFGVEIVSCPTCGRTGIDIEKYANAIESLCAGMTKRLTVAVMGCPVNGPGEAAEADVGVAGGDGKAVLFVKGKIVKTLPESEILETVMDIIEKW